MAATAQRHDRGIREGDRLHRPAVLWPGGLETPAWGARMEGQGRVLREGAGMSKKSKSETGPSRFAQPYIASGANAAQGAFEANQPNIANISTFLQGNMPSIGARLLDDPGLKAASGYNSYVLGGKFLGSNPNLQAIIDNTNSDVANKVNA